MAAAATWGRAPAYEHSTHLYQARCNALHHDTMFGLHTPMLMHVHKPYDFACWTHQPICPPACHAIHCFCESPAILFCCLPKYTPVRLYSKVAGRYRQQRAWMKSIICFQAACTIRCRPGCGGARQPCPQPAAPQTIASCRRHAGRTTHEGCGGTQRRLAAASPCFLRRAADHCVVLIPLHALNAPAGGAASLRQAQAAAAAHRPLHRSALVCLAAKQVEVAVSD